MSQGGPTEPFGGYGVGMPPGVSPDAVNVDYGPGGGGPGPRENFATLSLVFGVIGLLTTFCSIGVLVGVVAVVFGIVALVRGATGGQRIQAIIGIVLGALSPILYVGMFVLVGFGHI